MISRRIVVVALSMIVTGMSARAQQLPTVPLDSGRLVRYSTVDSGLAQGRLLAPLHAQDSTFIACRYPANPCLNLTDLNVRRVPLARLRTLEVAAGTHWANGLLVGGAIGAGLGMLFYQLAKGLCDESSCLHGGERAAFISVALFGALGAAFGSSSVVWRPAL